MNIKNITKDTTIEDLVNQSSEAVSYLRDRGIKCIACGEPIWGTIEEAAREKGFTDNEIQQFMTDLNKLVG